MNQFRAVIIGLLTGYFSGHLGIGGGLVITPAIRLILGFPAFIAVGTPLVTNIPTALAGAWSYGRRGFVDWPLAVRLAAGGAVGTIAGSYLTRFFSGSFILLVTAVVIFFLSFRFIFGSPGLSVNPRPLSGRVVVLAGIAIGVFAGFLGLGGGFLLVPFLNLIARRDIKTTFGTSLAAVSAITLPGAVVHYYLGHVNLALAGWLIVGMVPGAVVGARVALRLPGAWLRILFGLALMALAVYLGYFEFTRLAT